MSEIKPALTKEEWATMHSQATWIEATDGRLVYNASDEWHRHDFTDARHGLAALALYGQPFGFTREDVGLLRDVADSSHPSEKPRVNSIADRIEDLLPPEKEGA